MLKYPRKRHSRPQAFTLIELLVVISIISLMVSILMPALSAAREAAQSAVCLTNQRQIGLAIMMYANDSKDFMVPAGTNWAYNTVPPYKESVANNPEVDGRNGRYMWPALLIHLDYLAGELNQQNEPGSGWDVFACSAAPNQMGDGNLEIPGWFTYFISYGYNWNQVGASMGLNGLSGDAERYTPARQFEIVDPNSKVLMMDTVHNDGAVPDARGLGYNRVAQSNGSSVEGRPDARHSGAVNVVWIDGHASSVRSPDPDNFASFYTDEVFGNGGIGATGPNAWNRYDRGRSPN